MRAPGEVRRTPRLIAVAAVVLLVVASAGFYAYQKSNSVNVDPPTNQPNSPAVQNEPAGGQSAGPTETPDETKQATDERRPVTADEKVVKKQEKAGKQKVADRQQQDRAAAAEADRVRAEHQSPQEHPSTPEIPNAAYDPRLRQPPSTRREGNVVIRTFPDGTQLIITPDGRRVVVTPDGRRQVLRPGQRINRRRMVPRP